MNEESCNFWQEHWKYDNIPLWALLHNSSRCRCKFNPGGCETRGYKNRVWNLAPLVAKAVAQGVWDLGLSNPGGSRRLFFLPPTAMFHKKGCLHFQDFLHDIGQSTTREFFKFCCVASLGNEAKVELLKDKLIDYQRHRFIKVLIVINCDLY